MTDFELNGNFIELSAEDLEEVDGGKGKKSSDFIGQLNVVLFAPHDLYLFNDQPRERRRIMNQEIT